MVSEAALESKMFPRAQATLSALGSMTSMVAVVASTTAPVAPWQAMAARVQTPLGLTGRVSVTV